MRSYILSAAQRAELGFTDLFVLTTSDFSVGFSNKQITLDALAAGDVVRSALVDVKTFITGPTGAPTAQVKINTAAVAITPTVAVKTARFGVTNNTVVGAAGVTSADSIVLDLQLGAGDGAAATAGEVWVWVNRSLDTPQERSIQA